MEGEVMHRAGVTLRLPLCCVNALTVGDDACSPCPTQSSGAGIHHLWQVVILVPAYPLVLKA